MTTMPEKNQNNSHTKHGDAQKHQGNTEKKEVSAKDQDNMKGTARDDESQDRSRSVGQSARKAGKNSQADSKNARSSDTDDDQEGLEQDEQSEESDERSAQGDSGNRSGQGKEQRADTGRQSHKHA